MSRLHLPRFLRGRAALAALGGLALVAAGIVQSRPAGAYELWCFDDPTVLINGRAVHINLGIQADQATILGSLASASIVVHVPQGVTTQFVSAANTWYPETVTFKADKGGTWKSGPVPIQVDTTFVRKAGARALNSQEVVSTSSSSKTAQATIQGSMNLDISVP
jgi:hypothetical protein